MNNMSYIEIESEVAKQLAENTVQRIDKIRNDAVDRFVDKEMERINNGFFHKLFRRPDITRTEVFAQDYASEWSYIEMINYRFSEQYDTCKKVIHAARVGNKMTLTLEDYNSISG